MTKKKSIILTKVRQASDALSGLTEARSETMAEEIPTIKNPCFLRIKSEKATIVAFKEMARRVKIILGSSNAQPGLDNFEV